MTSISVCVLRTQTCTVWGHLFLFKTLLGRQILGDNWFILVVRLRTTNPNMANSDFSVSFCWFYKTHNLINTCSIQGGAGQQSSGRLGKPCPAAGAEHRPPAGEELWLSTGTALDTSKTDTPLHWATQIEGFVFLNLPAHLGKFMKKDTKKPIRLKLIQSIIFRLLPLEAADDNGMENFFPSAALQVHLHHEGASE